MKNDQLKCENEICNQALFRVGDILCCGGHTNWAARKGLEAAGDREYELIGRPKNQPNQNLLDELTLEQKRNPHWRDYAHCRALEPSVSDSLFFNVDTNDPLKDVRRAFCNACPVQRICRLYGDAMQPDYGAYGGYNATERRLEIRYPDTEPSTEAIQAE